MRFIRIGYTPSGALVNAYQRAFVWLVFGVYEKALGRLALRLVRLYLLLLSMSSYSRVSSVS